MGKGLMAAVVIVAMAAGAAFGQEVKLREGHERLMLEGRDLERVRRNMEAGDANWQVLAARMEAGTADVETYALVYLATGDEEAGRRGVEKLMAAREVEGISLGYDWLFGLLTEEQRDELFERAKGLVKRDIEAKMSMPWTNFVQRASYGATVAGAAFGVDYPEAVGWLEKGYKDWEEFHLPAVRVTAEGGGWPEGALYSYIVYNNLVKMADVFRTATDVNPYEETRWFQDRVTWWRFHVWPMPKNFHGRMFYMYHPYGDSEKWRAPMQNQEIWAELLVMRNWGETRAVKEWRWFMHQLGGPIGSPGQWQLLAYWDASAPVEEPKDLSWISPGTGQVFIRSSWEPTATWIAYQCGPRFTYHQHLDQGAFYIFKQGDLTGENGVYEPEGPSDEDGHLQAYASRAIAHNTINVYKPDEVFSGYRSGNSPRNDGGERTWRPNSNTALDAQYWKKGYESGAYETGRISEWQDKGGIVYIASDLTGAYNSTRYVSAPNSAKVEEVTRQLIYFRPIREDDLEALVVFDRVKTTDPSFETRILFQMANDPYVAGSETKVDECEYHYDGDFAQTDVGGGRLFMRFLYPEAKKIVELTSPGKHHWVFGKNYNVADTPWERDYGHGRLEVLSTEETKEHCFLTVLFPADKSESETPQVARMTSDGAIGMKMHKGDKETGYSAAAMFKTSGELSAAAYIPSDRVSGLRHVAPYEFGSGAIDILGAKAGGFTVSGGKCPRLSDVAVKEDGTEATVSWKTEEETVGYVEFGGDMNMPYLVSTSDEPSKEHSVRLRGLEGGKTFYVRAAAVGEGPITGFSKMMALDVPEDDTAPRIFDVKVERVNPTDVTLSWSTDDRAEGFVKVTGPQGEERTYEAPAGADQRVNLDGLASETQYTARITARNAGRLSAESEAVTFKTASPVEGYYENGFESGGLGEWEGQDKGLWSIEDGGEARGKVVALSNPERKRTQLVYGGQEYGDFTYKCKARTVEGGGNKFRDYAIVFGWQDAGNYYAAWFCGSSDESLPGIVRVVDGEWGIVGERPFKASLTDREWHEVEVVRRGARMQAFFDGQLAFEAEDGTFGAGKVGFGTNNDSAMFDDMKVFPEARVSAAPPEIRTKRLTVEGLVKE